MSRFDAGLARDLSRETYAPLSDAGNRPPQVFFEVEPETPGRMTARPPGALIESELDSMGDGRPISHLTIRSVPGDHHIADVTVYVPADTDVTSETIAIASALYWSWWRAKDMKGEAPGKEPPTNG